jgi:hypothetical protein
LRGCPPDIATNAESFTRYMMAHAVPFAARHIAYRGRTVASVRNDLDVRERVERFWTARRCGRK